MPTSVRIVPGPLHAEPANTLGVLGGGQLGRMFVQAAQQMGFSTVVLDPDPNSPAGGVSHHHIQADYLDEHGLAQLVQCASAITTEFENVPAQALRVLADQRVVAPGAGAVAIAQDRIEEKAHFVRCGVACAPYAVIASLDDINATVASLLPGILKTARMGYDGKGQQSVATLDELTRAWVHLGQVPCVLEKRLPLAMECSVIVARGHDGDLVHLPVQKNLHRDGILAVTEVLTQGIPPAIAQQALAAASAVAKGLNYVGVLCVEFFVLQAAISELGGAIADGLVVNEIAPRPHNSGHYSLDACDQSQFDLQVRTLAGLPLVMPRQHSPAIMLNLLGDLWGRSDGAPVMPDWAACLALPGAHLHLYGKSDPRPGRKMGHLTITGATDAQVQQTALAACAILGIAPF